MPGEEPRPGRYRHFKGKTYAVLDVAEHTETGERLVIYAGHNQRVWARPLSEFTGMVTVDGERVVPRFAFLEGEPTEEAH